MRGQNYFYLLFILFLFLFSCKEKVCDPCNCDKPGRLFSSIDTNKKLLDTCMVYIPAGSFIMGSPDDEYGRYDIEIEHKVNLSAFWISKYEITQEQWFDVTGYNPSYFRGRSNLPVESISIRAIIRFIEKLNAQTGKKYRLPTEAEWEYVCRAGTTTAFSTGDCLSSSEANFDAIQDLDYKGDNYNSKCNKIDYIVYWGRTAPVGIYPPNAWGLYDMHGNVWEMCSDIATSFDYYKNKGNKEETNPTGPDTTNATEYQLNNRILRGGCLNNSAKFCRSASRWGPLLDEYNVGSHPYIGFRLVLDAK